MRLSKIFWQTLKENPSDAEIDSHRLLLRAGLISKVSAGIYNYLPFAVRSIRKIEKIIREELASSDCQEIQMSVMTPAELWQETGRWDKMHSEMLKATDKAKRELCFSPTNEEAVTDIFRKFVTSYKQLPVSWFQINTKFRDEIRPRFGLMRGREFCMKDAYSFHLDKTCIDKTYDNFFQAYSRIFKRMGLEYIIVEADGGAIAGPGMKTHEFQVLAANGEDTVVYCRERNYAANIEKAVTERSNQEFLPLSDLKLVETKNKKTIDEVCHYLNISPRYSLKSLVYAAVTGDKEQLILVVLIGDDEINELKLKNYLACDHLVLASEKKLQEAALVSGYIGPYALDTLRIIYDQSINLEASYLIGANKSDYHYLGFSPKRDAKLSEVVDLRVTKGSDLYQGSPIEIVKGIEVGHIFQLGDNYTRKMQASVLDHNGKALAPLMGCYGIGVTRTLQAAIEQNHDDLGIKWPLPIAPFEVQLIHIGKSDEFKQRCDDLYMDLIQAGIEVLYDDRNAGAGFKLKDAELLGTPMIVVFGERDYQQDGKVELKFRSTLESVRLDLNDLKHRLLSKKKEWLI